MDLILIWTLIAGRAHVGRKASLPISVISSLGPYATEMKFVNILYPEAICRSNSEELGGFVT